MLSGDDVLGCIQVGDVYARRNLVWGSRGWGDVANGMFSGGEQSKVTVIVKGCFCLGWWFWN